MKKIRPDETVDLPVSTDLPSDLAIRWEGPGRGGRLTESILVLKYDGFQDDDRCVWVEVTFKGVSYYEYLDEGYGTVDDMASSFRKIDCYTSSPRLDEFKKRERKRYGKQTSEASQIKKHYIMYFDDVCALHVIASDVKVKEIHE